MHTLIRCFWRGNKWVCLCILTKTDSPSWHVNVEGSWHILKGSTGIAATWNVLATCLFLTFSNCLNCASVCTLVSLRLSADKCQTQFLHTCVTYMPPDWKYSAVCTYLWIMLLSRAYKSMNQIQKKKQTLATHDLETTACIVCQMLFISCRLICTINITKYTQVQHYVSATVCIVPAYTKGKQSLSGWTGCDCCWKSDS